MDHKQPADEKITIIINELQNWPGPQISSHKSAKQFFHKLAFLADYGLKADDHGIPPIIGRILSGLDQDDIPSLPLNIGANYGGTGTKSNAWALCDAPVTLYALKTMGVEDQRLDRAAAFLAELDSSGGYGSHHTSNLNWHGPGKKTDPCPYATLVMLKLLLQYGTAYRIRISACAECLLSLWENSRTQHPYIFYMGTDFRKLKLPFIWYDILHVTHVLSLVTEVRHDPRLKEMFQCIKDRETENGYIPESVYLNWKDWDFGQKKTVSPFMTECIHNMEERLREGTTAPATP